jgi:hypothetical protein
MQGYDVQIPDGCDYDHSNMHIAAVHTVRIWDTQADMRLVVMVVCHDQNGNW